MNLLNKLLCLTLGLALAGCREKEAGVSTAAAPSASMPVLDVAIKRGQLWIVDGVMIKGKPRRFLLDTGVTSMILNNAEMSASPSLTRAEEMRLFRQGWIASTTDGGEISVSTASDPRNMQLRVAPAIAAQKWRIPEGLPAVLANFDVVSAALGARIDGILGMAAMQSLTWRADYVKQRLTAYEGAPPAHDWQQCVYMTLNNGRMPLIPIALGDRSAMVVLDTGNNGDLSMAPEVFAELAQAHIFEAVSTGFSFDLTQRYLPASTGLLRNITVAEHKMPALEVLEATDSTMIGIGLLSKMDRVELDFRNYRFCFDAAASPIDSRLSVMGAAIIPSQGYLEVMALAPSGRVARSGVQTRDLITAIGPHPTSGMDLPQVRKLLDDPGTIDLTVRRASRPLVLKLAPLVAAAAR